METTDFMQEIPNSSFTIGDLIEAEIKNANGLWDLVKGRITNDINNDYALVYYKCPGHNNCLAWPDRCEDIGGDGEVCTTVINLSKLCGVQKTEDGFIPKVDTKAMLTPDEVKTLSEIVARYK